MTVKPQEGDWVRFYQNGELVIAQVEYRTKDVLGQIIVNTTKGTVCEESVLEIRRQKEN